MGMRGNVAMDDALDVDLRFAQIMAEEAKRTLVCTPVVAAGIRASLLPTPSTVLVVDDQALEAVAREAAQRLGRAGRPWSEDEDSQGRREWWRHPRLPWSWGG